MAVYQVITTPDQVLRAKAKTVNKINDGVFRVLDNMKDTLYAENGVGLAAPQIGISKRLVVIDTGDNYLELINPEIIEAHGEQVASEGCLSIPGIVGLVKRAERVVVKSLNRQGDCSSKEVSTAQVSQSKPYLARVYPISQTVSRISLGIST
jgi:peptide deformylase